MAVSITRTLVLDATLAVVPPRWQSQLAPDLYWGFKDPGDTLDYSVSLVAWLADIVDTIATVSCSITPASATVTTATSASGVITTIISGGVAGQRYGVTWTVATAGGRVVDITAWLDCQNRNTQPGQGTAALSYQLPVASTAELGGVIIGSGVTVNAGGTISVAGGVGGATTIEIGTVTSGATASASITGTAPAQTLDLTLPIGATGPAGPTGATGTAGPTGPAGPMGATGAAGPANTLSIGSVVSGATAAASITGTAPSQTLDLTLPLANATLVGTGLVTMDGALDGTIAGSGTIGVPAPTLGLVYSNGTSLSPAVMGSGVTLTSGTLTASGGGGSATTIDTGAGLDGGPISTSGTIYAATPVTTTYTASGTIAVSDVLSLVNAASAAAMTLAAGAVDGHCITVKRFGAGTVSVAATIDGASGTVEMASSTVKEALSLTWNAANTTWLLV